MGLQSRTRLSDWSELNWTGLPWWLNGKESFCSTGDASSIPGWGRSPQEEMATQSSILAWRISWTEEPMGLQRVRQNWATEHVHIPCFIPREVKSASFSLLGFVPLGASHLIMRNTVAYIYYWWGRKARLAFSLKDVRAEPFVISVKKQPVGGMKIIEYAQFPQNIT